MSRLILAGAQVLTPLEERFTNVLIEGDLIAQLSDELPQKGGNEQILDLSGCYLTPGLIDLQVNGGKECNFWGNPSQEAVQALCRHLLHAGVTCFLPTLVTDDLACILKNIQLLASYGIGKERGSVSNLPAFGLKMPGLHLEGPCLSPVRPGVHPSQWIQPLNLSIVEKLAQTSVCLITLAPEMDSSNSSLQFLMKKGIVVSLGHSNATFAEANAAFDQGIRLYTHTFNASPPIHHRKPGAVVAALLDNRVSCCVIADGLHVDPSMVKLLIRNKGKEKTILVTDAAQIGTSAGELAGSSVDLSDCVRNVVLWGAASFPDAIRMATWNAAFAVGLSESIGEIAPGKAADLVVWEKESLKIKYVISSGHLVGKKD